MAKRPSTSNGRALSTKHGGLRAAPCTSSAAVVPPEPLETLGVTGQCLTVRCSGGAQFRSRATTPVQFNRWHGPRRRSAAAHTSSTMIVPVARPVQERERPVTAGVFEAKDRCAQLSTGTLSLTSANCRVYLRPTGRYDLVGLSHRERVLLRGKRTGQRPLPSLSEQPHVFSLPGPTHMLADNWRARGGDRAPAFRPLIPDTETAGSLRAAGLMRGSASALNFPSLGLNGAPTRAPVLPCQSPLAVQAEARGCYQVGAPPDAHQPPAGQANPASRSCSALPLFQTSPLGRLSRTSLHHHSHVRLACVAHAARLAEARRVAACCCCRTKREI